METINHEFYVSLEVAKLLEQAGFDWKCEYAYMPSTEMGNVPFKHLHNITNYNELQYEVYSAPTLDVAQRWLRRMKGLFICVIPEIKDYHATWNFYICNEQGLFYENEDCFLTYEDALGSGEKKALELILEKGE